MDLVGRAQSIDGIERDLSGVVTLIGPCGSGKTAIARASAARRKTAFVALDEVKTEAGMIAALSRVLGVRDLRFSTVAASAAERGFELVVLDGVDDVRSLATDFAAALEGKVLVTAGRRLGLASERTVVVSGLSDDEAVILLEQRVRRHDPSWQAPSEARALVRALDGLPFAIEIAADRIVELGFDRASVDPFAADFAGGIDRAPRHRSLEAAFRWSMSRLTERTAAHARELAVFRGSFDHAWASELVGDSSAIDELVRSWLVVREGDRLRFLRSARHFLARSASRTAEDAHARFFAARGRRAAFELHEEDASRAGPELEAMREDLLAAFEHALAGDVPSAVALAIALDGALLAKSDEALHASVIARALDVAHDAPFELRMDFERIRARALFLRGHFTHGYEVALAAYEEARRRNEDAVARELAIALSAFEREAGDPRRAEEYARETLDEARAAGDRRIEVRSLHNLAGALLLRGELHESRELYLAALALARDVKASRVEALALSNLGVAHERAGDFEAARERFRQGIEAFARIGDELMANKVRVGFARASIALSKLDGVLEFLDDVRSRAQDLGDHSASAEADLGRGHVFAGRADAGRARAAYEDALASARLFGLADLRIEAEAALGRLSRDDHGSLRIAHRATWFERGPRRVELDKRPTLRRILARLVEMRLGCPGRTLSVDDLKRAGWPDERMTAESGAERVYSAIRTLRAFGLREVLLSRDGGYLLDPDVPIVRN